MSIVMWWICMKYIFSKYEIFKTKSLICYSFGKSAVSICLIRFCKRTMISSTYLNTIYKWKTSAYNVPKRLPIITTYLTYSISNRWLSITWIDQSSNRYDFRVNISTEVSSLVNHIWVIKRKCIFPSIGSRFDGV